MCVRPLLPLFEVNPKKQMASKVLAEMIQLCLHPTKEQTKPWMENSELKMEKKVHTGKNIITPKLYSVCFLFIELELVSLVMFIEVSFRHFKFYRIVKSLHYLPYFSMDRILWILRSVPLLLQKMAHHIGCDDHIKKNLQ